VSAALDVAWRGTRRGGLRSSLARPVLSVVGAPVACRSRAVNVAVADASIYLGVRMSVHKFQHFLLYVRHVC